MVCLIIVVAEAAEGDPAVAEQRDSDQAKSGRLAHHAVPQVCIQSRSKYRMTVPSRASGREVPRDRASVSSRPWNCQKRRPQLWLITT